MVMSYLGLSQTYVCVAGSTLFFLFLSAASQDCVIPDGGSASSCVQSSLFRRVGGQWYGQSVLCESHTSPDRSLGSQGSTGLAYRIGPPSSLILTSSGFCCGYSLLTYLLLQELL